LLFVLSAQAQTDAILPPIGGSGGGLFQGRCPQGQLLAGVELRTGDDVDAIRVICVTAYGPADVGPNVVGGENFGGNGAGLGTVQLLCPKDAPIVTGMHVFSTGKTEVVNTVWLFCGLAATTQTPSESPAAVFKGSLYSGYEIHFSEATQRCPTSLVAVGINGRSGVWLDAVGLICGVPWLAPKANEPVKALGSAKPEPVKAIGKVKGGAPTGPPISICEAARRARARSSPAAPGLEEKCRAAGSAGDTPPVPVGPSITANPNPVIVPNGLASGTTNITWKAGPAYTYCEIYLSVDNGEWSEFARGGDGTKPTTIKLGSSYTFRMMVYEGQAGTPKIITTLTVTLKN
jgi:hypothetical protein